MKNQLLIFLFLNLAFTISAQENSIPEDFEIWTAVDVRKSVNKKWNTSLRFAHRLDNNGQFQKGSFIEPKISYELLKDVETSLAVRLRYDFLDQKAQQLFISRTAYSYRIKPFDLSYRLRLENERGTRFFLDAVRNQFSLRYRRKKHKISPSIAYEWFVNQKSQRWEYNRWRAKVELSYRFNKRHRFSLGYIVQESLNVANPERDYVLRTSYRYTIKKKKKPKETI